MPAHFKAGPPTQQLLAFLADRKRRGQTFDEAWRAALRAPSKPDVGIRFPHSTLYRSEWLEAIESTRAEWEAAWHGRETPLSRALSMLTAVAVAEDFSVAMRRVLVTRDEPGAQVARAPWPTGVGNKFRLPPEVDWPETAEIAA